MSRGSSVLIPIAALALSIAAFLLARRFAARRAKARGASFRAQALARELAGPLASFLLVIPIALVGHSIVGVAVPIDGVVLSGVTSWLPAGSAGLLPNDRLLSMNGEPIRSLEQIRARIAATDGAALTFDVARGDQRHLITVQPVQQADHWMLGIAAPQLYRDDRSPAAILTASVRWPFAYLLNGLGALRAALVGGETVTLGGPAGLLQESDARPSLQLNAALYVVTAISLEVAVLGELLAGLIALVRWGRRAQPSAPH